ncbi:MAG TPA: PadR family transcriptional regulator [Oceanobacillus sp.]|nr:PadR family transcriptional regulator [Oceanobacillus sp.]
MFYPRFRFMKRKGFGFPGREFPFGDDFGAGPSGRGGHGRFRQRRGDIKFVLLELLKDEPHHGYELIKAIEERTGGFYRPSAGAIYPTLQLLEEEGSVTSEMIDDKRVYTITDAGRKLLEERKASHHGGFGPFGRHHHGPDMPQLHDLRRAMGALAETVMQVARYGTPEQVEAVQSLIESTNKEVHAILARKSSDTV